MVEKMSKIRFIRRKYTGAYICTINIFDTTEQVFWLKHILMLSSYLRFRTGNKNKFVYGCIFNQISSIPINPTLIFDRNLSHYPINIRPSTNYSLDAATQHTIDSVFFSCMCVSKSFMYFMYVNFLKSSQIFHEFRSPVGSLRNDIIIFDIKLWHF